MYTLRKGTEITAQVIRDVIVHNDSLKERYDLLEEYYIGQQAITRREKADGLSNNRVLINHAKYIVDVNNGYLMGAPVDYHVAEGSRIEPLLDAYKRQVMSDLDSEVVKDAAIFGLQYEYVYANEEAEPCSAEVDNRYACLVYDTTLEHNPLFGIIYDPIIEEDKIAGYDIIYCDDKVIREYTISGEDLDVLYQDGVERPHAFGGVPLIEHRNNPDYLGDFEPVISLIDAYNTLQSDRVNDKEQLVDAILVFAGVDFSEEQMESLRRQKVLSKVPADANVHYVTKTLNEADTDILRKNLEDDIHKISLVPNLSDREFMGNSSGVAIRYKLLLFEQNIANKERYFTSGLMKRFELYNNFLCTASRMEKVPITEVTAVFTRNLPQNDFETSQMINNLLGIVDTETLVSQLSFVDDASETIQVAQGETRAIERPDFETIATADETGA